MVQKEHSNPALRALIKECGIKDLQGIHDSVKDMSGSLIQEMLEGELENDIGQNQKNRLETLW